MFKRYAFSFSAFGTSALRVLLLLTYGLPAAAQAPAWQSARAVAVATAAATSNYSIVSATAVDSAGNVYLAGIFLNTVALGSTTLSSRGAEDVFVAKFNPAGNQFVWAQRAGGTGTDYPTALAVRGTGVYVAGNFQSPTADFGPTTLPNAGDYDGFVARLTDAGPTGTFDWAQHLGGTGRDAASALAVNGPDVYVAGSFAGATADFGPVTLTNAGSVNVFVAKLTESGPTGTFTWAQRAGGTGRDAASTLAVNGPNVYLAGGFESPTANFGPFTLTNADVAARSSDVFVAKLTDTGPTGTFMWAQRAGGTKDDGAGALAVNGVDVYVAGGFESLAADFGPTTLLNAGLSDGFVARLTDAGPLSTFAWAQRAGGTGRDAASALAVNGPDVYVAGSFAGATADFGPVTLTNAGTGGTSDVFVAKLPDTGGTGTFAWALRAGGTGTDAATTLAVRGAWVYVAGYLINSTADFGPVTLPNPNPNPATSIGFLASLTERTAAATTPAAGLEAAGALFPNPARHTVTLRLPAGATPASLTLTDSQGRAVRHYPAPAGPEAVLGLEGLPAGLYLLRGAGPVQRLLVN